ncbi:MAG: aldehyde dehydrogenase family protein, partial [Planctomycetia bacterium]
GPNNFPLAFNGVSGGDFAAAVAVGCPVLAKANPGHPAVTRLMAVEAGEALKEAGLPPAAVQLVYGIEYTDGAHLVSHHLVGAAAFTGSKTAGLRLKQAADGVGKPIYLELSSINPVVVLPGALEERFDAVVDELVASALMGAGQFCTSPGLLLLMSSPTTERFLRTVSDRFTAAVPGTLLSENVERQLGAGVGNLAHAGAVVLCGGRPIATGGYAYANTLLRATGAQFLAAPELFQIEAFGNAVLAVVVADHDEMEAVLRALEGNLTGAFYSSKTSVDEAAYLRFAPLLKQKVGRLLNDKMPTGVAVSSAMNHGGPFPASGHPGFTAVGVPASLRRFAALRCYDAVRSERLPPELRDQNTPARPWRFVDGSWTRDDLAI